MVANQKARDEPAADRLERHALPKKAPQAA
jgi:hypothetical protein